MSGIMVKCPFCESSQRVSDETYMPQGLTTLTKGLNRNMETKGLFGRDRASENIQRANEIRDITCFACGNTYRYDARTKQVIQ